MQQTRCRGAGEDSRMRSSEPDGRADDATLQGTALLDTHGVIRFCTDEAASAFGAAAKDLVGRPVDALVPELKLRRGTPGYNIAYALFWFPQQQWRTVNALSPDGRAFPLYLSVRLTRIDGQHQLLLSIRRPQAGGEIRRSQADTSDASVALEATGFSIPPAARTVINGTRASCASWAAGS